MKEKDFETLTNSMQEKLGKEYASKIADDLGTLITDNAEINKELKQKEEMIAKLKQDKENLIQVNGNLLQQVAMGEEPKQEKQEEKKKQPFDFRTAFDEYGNFKI